ncbi:MAG: acylphosphatase [Methyloceanibacter sp.]
MDAEQGDRRAMRVRIEGSVQGVGYRYWTERVATELGLTGWVRNRRDGSVEALFCGPREDVAQMLDRCRDGPRAAHVTAVEIVEEGGPAPDGFDVLPTA